MGKRSKFKFPTSENLSSLFKWPEILLMVQKSPKYPPGMLKNPVNSGINYLPTSTVVIAAFLNHQQ